MCRVCSSRHICHSAHDDMPACSGMAAARELVLCSLVQQSLGDYLPALNNEAGHASLIRPENPECASMTGRVCKCPPGHAVGAAIAHLPGFHQPESVRGAAQQCDLPKAGIPRPQAQPAAGMPRSMFTFPVSFAGEGYCSRTHAGLLWLFPHQARHCKLSPQTAFQR